MGKLHEVLAVEPDLKAAAQRAVNAIKGLFAQGQVRLLGEIRTYAPLDETGDKFPDEITELATTAEAELAGLELAYGPWVDAAIQKETTNQKARATVLIDGEELFTLPATGLLNLESKLAEIRKVYDAIPTLDPTEQWTFDKNQGHHISRERTSFRTKKLPRRFVKAEATKEHPAQVDVWTEDVRVGTWRKIIHSGMMTPVDKEERLRRIDNLIRMVRQARQRANDTEVEPITVAEKLFDYINLGAA